jgi:hypothetical protein
MSIDFSAQGITTRLRRVSQLRRLCLLLGKTNLVSNKINDRAGADKKHIAKLEHGKQKH